METEEKYVDPFVLVPSKPRSNFPYVQAGALAITSFLYFISPSEFMSFIAGVNLGTLIPALAIWYFKGN
jgi:hypothetical protein